MKFGPCLFLSSFSKLERIKTNSNRRNCRIFTVSSTLRSMFQFFCSPYQTTKYPNFPFLHAPLLFIKNPRKNQQSFLSWNIIQLVIWLFLQLCVWSTDGWEKQTSKYLQIPSARTLSRLSDTRVQFHQDQIHLLVVHETQIAIYEAPKLECLKQVKHIVFLLLSKCILLFSLFEVWNLDFLFDILWAI